MTAEFIGTIGRLKWLVLAPQKLTILSMRLKAYFLATLVSSILACSSPDQQQETLVELSKIAGKTKKQVETVLGKGTNEGSITAKGTNCYGNNCPKRTYKDGAVEIVYINDKADWITMHLKGGGFNGGALGVIGLPQAEPTTSNQTVMRWTNVAGYKEIACFSGEKGAIDYFYIKTATD